MQEAILLKENSHKEMVWRKRMRNSLEFFACLNSGPISQPCIFIGQVLYAVLPD